jgi:hypothetical protein
MYAAFFKTRGVPGIFGALRGRHVCVARTA